jgi:hypothetical protein
MATKTKAEQERDALKAELARDQARAAENDQQKWIRATIREEMQDMLSDFFKGDSDDDEGKPGGPGGFFDGLLGRTGS